MIINNLQQDTRVRQDKSAGTDTEALELARAQEKEEEMKSHYEQLNSTVKEQIGLYLQSDGVNFLQHNTKPPKLKM